MILKSIGVLSLGKIMGVIYAVMGLIFGGFFALLSLAGVFVQQAQEGNNPMAVFMGLGVAAVIIFPILYGILGFIGGIICALIYNVVANVAGGLEFEFQSNEPRD